MISYVNNKGRRVSLEAEAEEAISFSEYRVNDFREWKGLQVVFATGE
jgi:hypothetical protein